ncbi:MAG: guanylate kinase, partial [Myxococcaceae bacterium]
MSSGTLHRGLLLVLSAPSGTGKTTLARRFVEAHADAAFRVSVTTREPRGAERD